ncbi:hypothetical protein [Kerstersia gyiorum]|uniref:hypothetical protein n=1 Tax=Kerstersia gyiorum TaxID=206506 RepID=UPI00147951D4|nr:hypothetical protein [Kerstersia gyiorum]
MMTAWRALAGRYGMPVGAWRAWLSRVTAGGQGGRVGVHGAGVMEVLRDRQ